ncbi:MAG TPA: amidohydrolase family protein [Gammaproteobacteria bacterium]|nr:amidohydrolase family protein [Gammaproteobacteria bacterium]
MNIALRVCTAFVCCLPALAGAQDLTVTNARILDGTGKVINRGTVVVTGGKIASVSANAAPASRARTIDAGGKTVMPGFIDSHRHLVQGDGAQWLTQTAAKQMQEFLDAGFTTVASLIDPPQVLEARNRIRDGKLRGPRLYAGALIPVSGLAFAPGSDPARTDPSRGPLPPQAPAIPRDATIKAVDDAAKAGYDYLKVVMVTTTNGPELETLKLIVAEGKKRNVPTIVHAVSIRDTLAAVAAAPAVLVHTPHIGNLGDDQAALKTIIDARIPMTSTLSVFIPHFDAGNKPLFRDAQPFPWNTLSSGGQGPENARLLWENGLVSYGYGTDTQWPPKQSLADEVRALELVFSPTDVVKILTQGAAKSTLREAEIGTLEPGKLADIVIVDGDPLATTEALQHVVTTIKGGEVVFEKK